MHSWMSNQVSESFQVGRIDPLVGGVRGFAYLGTQLLRADGDYVAQVGGAGSG